MKIGLTHYLVINKIIDKHFDKMKYIILNEFKMVVLE